MGCSDTRVGGGRGAAAGERCCSAGTGCAGIGGRGGGGACCGLCSWRGGGTGPAVLGGAGRPALKGSFAIGGPRGSWLGSGGGRGGCTGPGRAAALKARPSGGCWPCSVGFGAVLQLSISSFRRTLRPPCCEMPKPPGPWLAGGSLLTLAAFCGGRGAAGWGCSGFAPGLGPRSASAPCSARTQARSTFCTISYAAWTCICVRSPEATLSSFHIQLLVCATQIWTWIVAGQATMPFGSQEAPAKTLVSNRHLPTQCNSGSSRHKYLELQEPSPALPCPAPAPVSAY